MPDKYELSAAQVRGIADAAATDAVQSTFRALGVDISNQDSLNAFRADLVWARSARRLHEQTGSRIILTVVSVLTGAFIVAAWDWITGRLGIS